MHGRTLLFVNLLLLKRFKIFTKITDSLPANSSASEADTQQIYGILLKMLDRWNAHDIEGYMEVYCKSPELLVVVDAEQFNGWRQLHDSYINGYSDRIAMGFIQPKRIQIKLLKPDLALALTWWSVSFPSSKQEIRGTAAPIMEGSALSGEAIIVSFES